MEAKHSEIIEALAGKLVVSCQDYTTVMIDAAVRGGAAGLRLNGPRDVRLGKKKTHLPVVGCNKMHFPNSPIYITPSVRAAVSLIRAGADIVALDCTLRPRVRQQPREIIAAIHSAGALALADLADIEDAKASVLAGADFLASTLAPSFDPQFIKDLAAFGKPVLAEGHIDNLDRARQAIKAGAWAVCVGTAITRPHVLTEQFVKLLGD